MASTIPTNKYVIVNENGLVISYFNGSDLPEYNENMIRVIDVTNINPQPNLNWTYSNGQFVEPAQIIIPELSNLQKIRNDYGTKLTSDIEYIGHTFNINVDTYWYISAYASAAGLVGVLPDGFYWLDKDNVEVPMTLDEFKEFAHQLFARGFVSFQEYVNKRKTL